ncbi:uncharacterized protein ZBAI_05058 [Zygosaccharomyces bailii ISA1307]|nr:uncharacterized protein ZBAI_05058 [Zygosaccharomyces bailii ISA1307]
MAKKIICAFVQIKHAEDAPRLIDYAIRECLSKKKPCYIEIPTNMPSVACAPLGPIEGVLRQLPSEEKTLKGAVEATADFIDNRLKTTLLAGPKLKCAGAQDNFIRLAGSIGCAVAILSSAKITHSMKVCTGAKLAPKKRMSS